MAAARLDGYDTDLSEESLKACILEEARAGSFVSDASVVDVAVESHGRCLRLRDDDVRCSLSFAHIHRRHGHQYHNLVLSQSQCGLRGHGSRRLCF